MESNTGGGNEAMDSANSRLNELNTDSSSRPDWDPYAVWLTHIMKTPATQTGQTDTNTKASNDSSWNPYSVWQALIKN